MSTHPTVLVHHDLPIARAIESRIDDATVIDAPERSTAIDVLPTAEIFIVNPTNWRRVFLEQLNAGDWVQATSAGYARFPVDQFRDRDITFANAGDVHSVAVADHAMACLLSLTRGIPTCVRNQTDRTWDRSIGETLVDLADRQMLIIGLGSIGEAIATRAHGFSMTVHGVKRDVKAYDGILESRYVHRSDQWTDLLKHTDVLVVAVPLTDRTRGLIDTTVFTALPSHALVINVARGPIVDESALLNALDRNDIGAAALDVFSSEPLPESSPLWDHNRVLITPHIGGRSQAFVERFVDRFLTNFARWRRGKQLHGQIQ